MNDLNLEVLTTDLLQAFFNEVDYSLLEKFEKLEESPVSIATFSFYTSVSAVFSSKIEGEDIELDSFIKHKLSGVKFLPDYTQKIDDLYAAYQLAKTSKLTEQAVKECHILLITHILQQSQRGEIRNGNMVLVTPDGRIEYVACAPDLVKADLAKLYRDIELLLKADLNIQEVFYFASLIHLVFVKIHPYNDGNGRTARLLEKWFLAQKLGEKAWFLQSEKMYYNLHNTYYQNIRHLGLEYLNLDYRKAMSFLKMLPQALDDKN